MKLDRNDNTDGQGKYALILLRALVEHEKHGTFGRYTPEVQQAFETLAAAGALDWGYSGSASEFFLVRLKDRSAEACLRAYADDAMKYDPEWAHEVYLLADRARNHPNKKTAD